LQECDLDGWLRVTPRKGDDEINPNNLSKRTKKKKRD